MSLFVNFCIDHLPELRQINALSGWLLVGVLVIFLLVTIWDMIQDAQEGRCQMRADGRKYRRAEHGKEQ